MTWPRPRSILLWFSITILILACGSALNWRFANRLARRTRTPVWCRLIIVPPFSGGRFELPSLARSYCSALFVAETGDIEDCLRLDAVEPSLRISQRHACIDSVARRLLSPDFCEMIDYPEGDSRKRYAADYQDRCRADAISQEDQCHTGFKTEGWAEGVSEKCIRYIAANLLDPEVCEQLPDEEDRSSCLEGVETAKASSY